MNDKIRQQFICHDCSFDTFHSEYYMLKHNLWDKLIGKENIEMLCIGCVENRLGRELVSSDFLDCPLNYEQWHQSDRLKSRIGDEFYLSWRNNEHPEVISFFRERYLAYAASISLDVNIKF